MPRYLNIDVTKRLNQAIDYILNEGKAKSSAEIARAMGYNPKYLSDVRNCRQSVSVKLANSLENDFRIRKSWLMLGKGEMLIDNDQSEEMHALHQALDLMDSMNDTIKEKDEIISKIRNINNVQNIYITYLEMVLEEHKIQYEKLDEK